MLTSRQFQLCAAGVGMIFLGGALFGLGLIGSALMAGGALLLVASIYLWLQDRRKRRYSFDELLRVHERAELDEIELEVPDDMVYCIHCGGAYPAEFPACPGCATRK